MAQKVTAWRALDGELFETEDDAKSYDFEKGFNGWMDENFDKLPRDAGAFKAIVMRDRMKLLGIFKLLNGCTPQVTLPRLAEDLAEAA
jgi:hypothetical protein